jgi:Putative auto-transporter adhesin, head GIN domain
MKNLILMILIFPTLANAQLFGSGKIITREFNYKDFDKVSIEDFDGQVEIEVGKPFAIKIEIDENLEPRLRVTKDNAENQLNIILEGNKNGRLYLENTRIKIKISMPEASVISHRGNTNVNVHGILGRYFRLETTGNGDVFLSGSINELDIKKSGNGEVKAQKLISKTAKVKSYGNGNVVVNSQISLQAHGTGNCSIMQAGPGKIDPMSGVIGNGDVRKI